MKWFKQIPVFPLIAGVSLVVGRLIPAFYDWTGSDQSRPSPLIWQTALCLLVGGITACLALPWLRLEYDPPVRASKHQFTVRTLLAITTVVAVVMVAFRSMPLLAVSCSLLGIALYYVVECGALFPCYRWPVVSLLACLYFPYAWIVSLSHLPSRTPELWWMASGLPALLFTMLTSSLVQRHSQELVWLSMLLTGGELMLGIWLIRLGPRRFVAYLVFVLIASLFGSFILNALMRM